MRTARISALAVAVAAAVLAGVAASPLRDGPPPARADDATAPLDADSSPAGATVLVDGAPVGRTPLVDAPVAPGTRRIRIELAEHEPFETTVEVSAGGRARIPAVNLVPWPRLTADARAADAVVAIDGAPPAPSGRVAPGRHVVTFTRPGHAEQRHPVDVASGRDLAVEAAPWQAFQAVLDLSGLPKDAVAELDGARVSGVLSWPAAHKGTLRITRPGHFPRIVDLDIALGARRAIDDAWTKVPESALRRAKGLGDAKADAAVADGLAWLARHRSEDGRWDCDGFMSRCPGQKCGGWGESVFDPGVTGLAVQAFLGAGATHVEGPHAATVGGALGYLRDIQDSEGCFGPRTSQQFEFNHAAAATAMLEAYWITGDRGLRESAGAGLRFTLASQNPYLAWRYGVRDGDNDTAATIFQSIVVRTAEWTDLAPVPDWRANALAWIDKMTDPTEGRTGYQSRGGHPSRLTQGGTRTANYLALGRSQDISAEFPSFDSESLTAGALLVRRLVGDPDESDMIPLGESVVAKAAPFAANGWIDLHYALWGSLLHAQAPKGPLARWRKDTLTELLARQMGKELACSAGAWEASKEPFGAAGGRIYSTAMALLAIEAPNRWPVVPRPARKPAKPSKK